MKIYKISEILKELEESINKKKSFSLIRWGDGAIKLIHSLIFNDRRQLSDICKREGIPENKIIEVFELWGRYARSANFIDCPGVYYMPNIFWGKYKKGLRSISKKTELRMKMWEDLYSRAEFDNDRYCNPEINYLSCLRIPGRKNLLDIIKDKKICCICTCPEVVNKVPFNFTVFQIVNHFENQYENSFEKVIKFIEKEANNFDIFLISAGELGRIYSGYIKECGGRAFDFGFMINCWLGEKFTSRLENFIKLNPRNKLEFVLTENGELYKDKL